ncbi:26860_t:CDS:2 [Gigaspora margarita]|uniref:26860_t:CDS:1 n=1 Tax=Gigaspora margarita TaxID=4874 RepID=A0ABN7UDG8_GIGMA|nr:26860_t:CDS:2 [Gigaspora margarita]
MSSSSNSLSNSTLGTTTYAKLSKILSNQISIHEAAKLQSIE